MTLNGHNISKSEKVFTTYVKLTIFYTYRKFNSKQSTKSFMVFFFSHFNVKGLCKNTALKVYFLCGLNVISQTDILLSSKFLFFQE